MFYNGDVYVGEHFKGKMHGKGQYKWTNGSVYIGEFKKGLKCGKGIKSINFFIVIFYSN